MLFFFYEKRILNIKNIKIKDIYNYYDTYGEKAKLIMIKKNCDYKEAWKIMEFSSIKDIIIQKILRIQNVKKNFFIIENFFEKIYDNYIDILNYSVFILMKKII
ncbi:hypothetical protein K645_2961 (plasmid) [Blattabacterium sp. (Nauphoeta cinerea)]|uniref:nucleotide modification associated domain-containing protein n=1 Tax=Blattabacterium sp. (Nauphoeta cinerea) TaxID=1316444 RepID=UPI0003B05B2C|nr:nucleotide modification associated domain-containing protein [Blattabacterium sp. (Nauphoeta cinerea)]AGW86371.1 hypothetical protein K645_2961 [Blattabacterium sp. (Nauphoeta cinerea)]